MTDIIQPKLLSITILGSGRIDLLRVTISSLLRTITYPHWEMIIYNHQKPQEFGREYLINAINGDYVLCCEDDWFFIERGDWVQQAIENLNTHPEIGIVKLRKADDGQKGNDSFTNNPNICRASDLKEAYRMIKDPLEAKFEKKMLEVFDKLGKFPTNLVGYKRNGVAIHTGWGRGQQ